MCSHEGMTRRVLACIVLGFAGLPLNAACQADDDDDAVRAAPYVEVAASAACQPSERMVRNVCTALGGGDECVAVADVCIRLCDDVPSCSSTSDRLRPLSGWPTAPDGYCVPCLDEPGGT